MTSLFIRMDLVSSLMERRSLPAIKGAAQQRPQTHMCAVLVSGHPPVADLEHIRIIPVSRPGVGRDCNLAEPYAIHRLPLIADISRRPPRFPPVISSPLPWVILAVPDKD